MVYSTDRSKAVVPVLVLLFVVCGLFSITHFWQPSDHQMTQHIVSVESSALLHYRLYAASQITDDIYKRYSLQSDPIRHVCCIDVTLYEL